MITEETASKICPNFFSIRSAVGKRSWEIMREEGVPWEKAITRAWREAKDRCAKFGYIV